MISTYSLALVDPDETFARSLRSHLELDSFRVSWYSTTASAAAALQNGTFDLCVLSIDLREIDGVEICRTLRQHGVTMPVIAVTSRFEAERSADALAAGADDVVSRTITARELIARIKAVLRRGGKNAVGPAYEDDDLKVLLDQMRAIVRGEIISLSRGEARVLAILIHESPAPVPASRLWNELSMEEQSLKQATIEARIKSLRRKLGRDRIETRARLGYAFIARH